jgi:hypothetical protein
MPNRSKAAAAKRPPAKSKSRSRAAARRSAASRSTAKAATTSAKALIESLRRQLSEQEKTLRCLADRQAIMDCAVAFSRGVNRRDRELLRSVFHPDAVDDHGFFVGNRDDFLDWIDTVYEKITVTQHFVTNQTVEIDGDTAHAETYWIVANVYQGSISVVLRGGRYIDRLERREGVWAIVNRVCLIEWNCTTGDMPMAPDVLTMLSKSGVSATDRSDPSYMRPLQITRQHQSLHAHTHQVPANGTAAPGSEL